MNKFSAITDNSFKLSNGQTVDKNLLEQEIKNMCHYVAHVVIAQKDAKSVAALIFPNKKLLTNPEYAKTPEEGCFCPRNLHEFGKCLTGCMHTVNLVTPPNLAKIAAAVIIDSELTQTDGTLTQSLAVNEDQVIKKYKSHLLNLFGEKNPTKENSYNLKFI